MQEDPRFQRTNGLTKQGYDWSIGVAPHVEIDIPGFGEMSGTTLRKALKDASPEVFEQLMGWYNQEVYDILQGKLQEISSGGGGAVAGAMAVRRDDEENDKIVNEVMNYLLGISVG